MITSEQIGQLAGALAKAQAELKNPAKDRTASINSQKGSFKYTYADFATSLDAIRLVLAKHELSFVQATEFNGQVIVVQTRIMHKSGEWLESSYPVGGMADHRTMGSALSYARRYAFFSLIGVQGEDDDDGEADQQRPPAKVEAKSTHFATESLFEFHKKALNTAETQAAFEEAVSKARVAAGRMTQQEKANLSNVVEARRHFWAQSPIPEAAE